MVEEKLCPDACESGACQRQCAFCDETLCRHSLPCTSQALDIVEAAVRWYKSGASVDKHALMCLVEPIARAKKLSPQRKDPT